MYYLYTIWQRQIGFNDRFRRIDYFFLNDIAKWGTRFFHGNRMMTQTRWRHYQWQEQFQTHRWIVFTGLVILQSRGQEIRSPWLSKRNETTKSATRFETLTNIILRRLIIVPFVLYTRTTRIIVSRSTKRIRKTSRSNVITLVYETHIQHFIEEKRTYHLLSNVSSKYVFRTKRSIHGRELLLDR